MTQFSPPDIWKRHAYQQLQYEDCITTWSQSSVQRILNELHDSNGDYEGVEVRKAHSDSFDEKRTPEFVGEILDMINNDTSKWIRTIASVMGKSEFFYQASSEWRYSLFLYKMKNAQFLSQW